MARVDHEARWRDRLRRWEASGATAAEFCRSEGVSKGTFYMWRRRLRAGDEVQAVEFVEVSAPPSSSALELEIAGVVVRVPPCFDEAHLGSVLRALGWSGR